MLKYSFEGLGRLNDDEMVDGSEITEDLVLQAMAESDEANEALTRFEALLSDGATIDRISDELQGTIHVIATEGLSAATLQFFNADGALDAVAGQQLVWDESKSAELATAALEGLKAAASKTWETVVRWFKKLLEWIGQLIRKFMDLFISNEKILTRMETVLKKKDATLRVDPEKAVSSGMEIDMLLTGINSFVKRLDKFATSEQPTADDIAEAKREADGLAASVKTGMSVKALGYTDKTKVLAVIQGAKKLSKTIQTSKKAQQVIEKARDKAITEIKKIAGADARLQESARKEIQDAKDVASRQSQAIALCVRLAKFMQSQAIGIGRLWK